MMVPSSAIAPPAYHRADVLVKFARKAYESGNLTVDEALNHPVYWESAPNKNEYGAYEAYQQRLAKKMGMTPAELQEKMWVGAGNDTGLGSDKETFLRTVAKRVQYTAAYGG